MDTMFGARIVENSTNNHTLNGVEICGRKVVTISEILLTMPKNHASNVVRVDYI